MRKEFLLESEDIDKVRQSTPWRITKEEIEPFLVEVQNAQRSGDPELLQQVLEKVVENFRSGGYKRKNGR